MHHRHLNHRTFSLAAIDDIIARGGLRDWVELRNVVKGDRTLLEKVQRVCTAHIVDPYAQRFHLWMHYAQRHLA